MHKNSYRPLTVLVDLDGVVNILHSSPEVPVVRAELDGFILQGDPQVLAELDRVITAYNLRPT